MATKPKKRRVAPCNRCKGHTVPSRRVKSVKRDAKGRFKK